MAVKKCCIENCYSCSTRKEDIGVTYHKYPKDVPLCDKWLTVTQNKHFNIATKSYVCSRHFRKRDFQVYKDSKYVLKSDAVPSIFPWVIKTSKMNADEKSSGEFENVKSLSTKRKLSETENVDAIKKFIEEQEKEINEQKCDKKASVPKEPNDWGGSKIEDKVPDSEMQPEPLAVATSVMDFILSESEARILNKREDKGFDKHYLSTEEKGNSMALSVGSKVEAKDFGEYWHPAQILEVDYDEMEVLVHYENDTKKHDEWISVSSPRLRPVTNITTQSPTTSQTETLKSEPNETDEKEEVKHEEKQKLKFEVGERCLARWRDNRRFMATIYKDLGNGSYEVIFDDGFQWKCTTSRMYKLKDTAERMDPLAIDTSSSSSTSANPSPIPYGAGPSSATSSMPQMAAFHTHLFDPTRDYLGSKSERREKKRKLNIKEIFNIGQKKRKKQKSPKATNMQVSRIIKQRKPTTVRKKIHLEHDVKLKNEIPDAVASIIGTVANIEDKFIAEASEEKSPFSEMDTKEDDVVDIPQSIDNDLNSEQSNNSGINEELSESKNSTDPVLEEETKLENFEVTDNRKHEEVIDRIKEVIIKLEDGMYKAEKVDSPNVEIEKEISEQPASQECVDTPVDIKDEKSSLIEQPESSNPTKKEEKTKKSLSKMKKSKKLRLLQEKKVKKQVEKVKCELAEMKRQVEEMKKQIGFKREMKTSPQKQQVMPKSFLLPGEWCCRWVNGQPVGAVSEIESEVKADPNSVPPLPRRSVQVEDDRLPEGWTKHMVRRSLGNSAGKWDVVLISPDNRRFHTKTEMRSFLENESNEDLRQYEYALLDFASHLKLSRRMGWITYTGIEEPVSPVPAGLMSTSSPLVKRKKLSLKKMKGIVKTKEKRRWGGEVKMRRMHTVANDGLQGTSKDHVFLNSFSIHDEAVTNDSDNATLEDGYVFVGALKVQLIDNLLRCPADGCTKNFRNNTLLKMHIKHYHRELRKMLGATPRVQDLAYARARPTKVQITKLRKQRESKVIKVKIPRPSKRAEEMKRDMTELDSELKIDIPLSPQDIPMALESPKLRNVPPTKPVKRPKVLLPVRRIETDINDKAEELELDTRMSTPVNIPKLDVLDFETAISTHTVTKPNLEFKKRVEKKRRDYATFAKKPLSDDEEWLTMNSDFETRSSFPGSGTPDSKTMDNKISINAAVSSESNEDQKESMYTYSETGERIKIVQMKREEIINCHCGYREEDGLMVQCELCLCWQHALCHNIQKESEVPEKYTCSICLNPRRGRRSKRFVHDQDRLYEGLLPGSKPCEALRRSHELAGNLLRVQDTLHALRVKYIAATTKGHPKLYLWAKDWESSELSATQEKLNSDYSDLNIIINNIGKENLPVKTEEVKDINMGAETPSSEENEDRFSHRDESLGSQTLLSGLLTSPGGALELPISTSDLERLAKSVEDQPAVRVPQPEAAIDNEVCRERLLRHILRCQAAVDARLDSIEAQVAELESQDPSFEDDETAEYFPRTKQTIQMLLRDLDTMEELGVIT